MSYRMCNHDFDVVYQGISQSIRHTEKYSYILETDRETVEELIEMAEVLLKNLQGLDFND